MPCCTGRTDGWADHGAVPEIDRLRVVSFICIDGRRWEMVEQADQWCYACMPCVAATLRETEGPICEPAWLHAAVGAEQD